MMLYFDQTGNLGKIWYWSDEYRLPPTELITPDTPIEPPPLPDKEHLFSKKWLQQKIKGEQRLPVGFVVPVPEFRRLAYDDAKVAVDIAIEVIVAVRGTSVVPEYSRQVAEQLRSEDLSADKKALAIYMLSKVAPRDTISIQTAIEWIDLKVNVPYRDSDWRFLYPWSSYPARDALLRIGEASVGPIVQDLPGETNVLRRQLLCAVVSTFGRTNWTTAWQPRTAIDQLQRLRATESELSRRHNIDEALGLLIDNKVDLNIGWLGYLAE